MFYAYVLFSKADRKFYTGYSADLKGRFEAHANGKLFLRNRLKSYLTG